MSTIESTALPASEADPRLVLPGRGLPIGAGMSWIGDGWRLFTRAPLMWIVILLVLFVIAVVMNFVPFVGGLAFQVLNPVFAAGLIVACRSLERGGEIELEHLFAGFKKNFGSLAIIGAILLAAWIVIFIIGAVIMGFGVIGAMMAGDPNQSAAALAASGLSIALGTLVILALTVPVLMFYWFAPALVIMHDMPPIAAMKASFMGCLRNFITFIVYGIVMMVLALIAVIPFGLGMLVWIPLAITSTYAAYRQIFTEGGVMGSEPIS